MDKLYEPSSYTGDSNLIDTWRCSQTPEDTDGDGRANVPVEELPASHPCRGGLWAYDGTFVSNPDLDPETSDNWTAGFVWSPTTDFSLLADYYDIEIDDQIWDEDVQRLVDEEFHLRQAGETGPTVGRITRDRRGLIADYVQTYENIIHWTFFR